jgi:hypothetical protein
VQRCEGLEGISISLSISEGRELWNYACPRSEISSVPQIVRQTSHGCTVLKLGGMEP